MAYKRRLAAPPSGRRTVFDDDIIGDVGLGAAAPAQVMSRAAQTNAAVEALQPSDITMGLGRPIPGPARTTALPNDNVPPIQRTRIVPPNPAAPLGDPRFIYEDGRYTMTDKLPQGEALPLPHSIDKKIQKAMSGLTADEMYGVVEQDENARSLTDEDTPKERSAAEFTYDMLKQFEGEVRDQDGRHKPYQGPGHGEMAVIGYGHHTFENFEDIKDRRMTEEEAEELLREDVQKATAGANRLLKDVGVNPNTLSLAQHSALVQMAFQMGTGGLAKFKKMFAAIKRGDWAEAEKEALDSKWARQTSNRAKKVAALLRQDV